MVGRNNPTSAKNMAKERKPQKSLAMISHIKTQKKKNMPRTCPAGCGTRWIWWHFS